MIDGYDWDVSDESPEDRAGRMWAAIERARDYRLSQPSVGDVRVLATGVTTPNTRGWLHAATLVEGTQQLRVYWHPDSDRVRIDRPPPPPATTLAIAPDPLPERVIRFRVSASVTPATVRATFRHLADGDMATLPVIRLVVPPPGTMTHRAWCLRMNLAQHSIQEMTFPPAILACSPSERWEWFVRAFQEAALEALGVTDRNM